MDEAGVKVPTVRYDGMIHNVDLLNGLAEEFDKHYGEQNELVDSIAERIQLLGSVSLVYSICTQLLSGFPTE